MIKLGLKSAVSMLVLAMLFGGANRVMAQYQEGDLNHDGVIDVADLTQIIDMMANGGGKILQIERERDNFQPTKKPIGLREDGIDLDLPSHRRWANRNVGAVDSEGDYGKYFAWGEIVAHDGFIFDGRKRKFDWPSYEYNLGYPSWETIEKYHYRDNQEGLWYDLEDGTFIGDGKDHLDGEDDAAARNWEDASWRMPNYLDVVELIEHTNKVWCLDSDIPGFEKPKGHWGCKFSSLVDSTKYIFLPAAGQADDKYVQYRDNMDKFGHGLYWTSSIYPHHSAYAYVMDIDKYLPGMDMREGAENIEVLSWYYRCLGCTIRPVKDDK